MPIHIWCPGCQAGVVIPDHLAERAARCPRCKTVLTAASGPGGPSGAFTARPGTSGAPTAGPGPEEALGQRPRGRRGEPERPAGSGTIAWVVGGIVLGVLLLGCGGLGVVSFLVYRAPGPQPPGQPPTAPPMAGPAFPEDPWMPPAPGPRFPPDGPGRVAGLVRWEVADGGNGHYYEFVADGLTWSEAKRAAEGRVFKGVRGHLATITSAEEKDFLRRALSAHKGWLGGYQDTQAADYAEPGGGWRWVTGEEWKYTNWSAMSPDEYKRGQNYLVLDPAARPGDGTSWDDAHDDYSVAGYYVEYPMP